MKLTDEYHWVSCSVREFGPIGYDRHIVRRGGITTACGATASHPDVWVPNKHKASCLACIKGYGKK